MFFPNSARKDDGLFIESGGMAYRVDEDGFLIDPSLWSEELGRSIAAEEGVHPLTAEHWRVISHIRGKFLLLGALPNLRQVCRATDLSRSEIKGLFGHCLAIWRIAGLPHPGEEALTYMN